MLPKWLPVTCLAIPALALAACAGTLPIPHPGELPNDAALVSGQALFDRPIAADEQPDADLRGLDPAMREFVATAVRGAGSPDSRVQRLFWEMRRRGLLSLDYQSTRTTTASETFHSRTGNCLAFTNLFVALAREAGLRVAYQVVDIPPMWSSDSGSLVLSQHVNVRILSSGLDRSAQLDQVVDFNLPDYSGNYPQQVVADHVIDALFYNNLAVSAMQDGQPRTAFVYFIKALRADPDSASAWANLGVLYQRQGVDDYAEAAFHRSLRADRHYKVAMSNLARLYGQRGETDLAQIYRDRIHRHQQRNPYHHFLQAEQAFAAGDTRQALGAIDRAIRMRDVEHEFHFLRARIMQTQGNSEAARVSLERAHAHATFAALRASYRRKLDALN